MEQVYFVRRFKNVPGKWGVVFYPWCKGGPESDCYKRVTGPLAYGEAIEKAASMQRGVWILGQ